ncbi:N-succinylarginine dihydrolase [Vibrio sp. PP-XX7]
MADAVSTYLFNSQLLTKADGKMLIVVPQEACEHQGVWRYLSALVEQGDPINEVKVFDLRESMRNGGGPACLRLRVVLNDAELQATNPNVMMNDSLYHALTSWIEKRTGIGCLNRIWLTQQPLAIESAVALDELTQMMKSWLDFIHFSAEEALC